MMYQSLVSDIQTAKKVRHYEDSNQVLNIRKCRAHYMLVLVLYIHIFHFLPSITYRTRSVYISLFWSMFVFWFYLTLNRELVYDKGNNKYSHAWSIYNFYSHTAEFLVGIHFHFHYFSANLLFRLTVHYKEFAAILPAYKRYRPLLGDILLWESTCLT